MMRTLHILFIFSVLSVARKKPNTEDTEILRVLCVKPLKSQRHGDIRGGR